MEKKTIELQWQGQCLANNQKNELNSNMREMFVIVLPSFWRVLHAKPRIVRMSQFLDTHFFVLFLNTAHFFFLFLNTENAGSFHVLGNNDQGGTNDEFVLSVGSRKCLRQWPAYVSISLQSSEQVASFNSARVSPALQGVTSRHYWK
jgi:hypothetical protein